MEPLLLLGFLALPLLLLVVWLIVNFNRFTSIRQHLRESWADIDVELKRRYDLIPNLVETVKGYARHEQQVLQEVVQLRNQALENHGSIASQALDQTKLQIAMKRLFAIVENYPQLKADTHFLALQKELANTEDRIAAARRFYNANVREMNQLCQQFPTNLLASWFGFHQEDYFELANESERVVPRMQW